MLQCNRRSTGLETRLWTPVVWVCNTHTHTHTEYHIQNHCVCGLLLDFSDSVSRPAQSGFKVQPDDLEVMVVEREPETIMQRYQRLKQEVSLWCTGCMCEGVEWVLLPPTHTHSRWQTWCLMSVVLRRLGKTLRNYCKSLHQTFSRM